MQKEYNSVSLLITSMIRSSQMPWYAVPSRPGPIHTHLTSESLVLSVNRGKQQSGLFTPYSWEQDFPSWLKYWSAHSLRPKKLSIIFYNVMPVGLSLRGDLFRKMHEEVISQGWMDVELHYQEQRRVNVVIYACRGISNQEKQ